MDVFVDWTSGTADQLGEKLKALAGDELQLVMISNRGTKVWPGGFPDTLTCDTWRCRFQSNKDHNTAVSHEQIIALLGRLRSAGLRLREDGIAL